MSVARFFSSVFAADSPRSDWVDSRDHWIVSSLRGARTESGAYVTERSALSLTGVQCCIRLIANASAALPAAVEQFNEKTREWTEIHDDPREWLLNVQPNEYMPPIVARTALEANKLLSGNAYGEIARNGRGQAIELSPIPAGSIAPVQVRENERRRIRYQGSIDGDTFDEPPSEVVHLRGALSLDGILGLSPIAESRRGIGLAIATERFGAQFFGRDLKSGGWIQGVKEKGDALANFREYVNEQGGPDNAHLVKILGEGMTFTPGTVPPEDAQFLQTREYGLADVCRLYGVPLELVMAQGKTSSWGSGIEQLFLAFVELTVWPHALQSEQEFSLKLLTNKELRDGVRIRFKVREILRGDMSARSAYFERMHRIGVLSPNEIRIEEGRNPVPGGDVFADPSKAPGGLGPKLPPDPREQELDRERKEEAA